MAKKSTEKIAIFGSSGDIGSYLLKHFRKNYEVLSISKKNSSDNNNVSFSNFKSDKNYLYPKNKNIKDYIFNSKGIIISIGKFKKSKNNLDLNLHLSNFETNYKLINYLVKNKKKFRNNCRLIVITSMNSEIINLNSLQYAMSKSKLSMAIKSFKSQLKTSKLSIEDLMPGPISTNMREKKILNNLSKNDIYKLCDFLIKFNCEITFDKIKVFNKKNYFNKY